MNPYLYLTEIFADSEPPILFVDFDGTISKRDVIDAVLAEFADDRWLEVENQWLAGKIGSRECLRKQFSFVKATAGELDEFLDTLEIDEGLPTLLNFCREAGIKIHVISDGFEYYIRRLLAKNVTHQRSLDDLRIWANRLIPKGKNRWETAFPYFDEVCPDGCATCKPEVMKRQNSLAVPSIFIGDGLSDRFAAQNADLVFAKHKLSEFCLQNQIPQTTYTNLRQVAENLDQAFESFVFSSFGSPRLRLKAA